MIWARYSATRRRQSVRHDAEPGFAFRWIIANVHSVNSRETGDNGQRDAARDTGPVDHRTSRTVWDTSSKRSCCTVDCRMTTSKLRSTNIGLLGPDQKGKRRTTLGIAPAASETASDPGSLEGISTWAAGERSANYAGAGHDRGCEGIQNRHRGSALLAQGPDAPQNPGRGISI